MMERGHGSRGPARSGHVRRRIRLAGAAYAVALAAAVVLIAGTRPAPAQLDPQLIAEIRANTPSCRDHPDAPWIGRLAGNYDDLLDRTRMISFVGCFPDRARCVAWLERSSGRMPEITVYECRPR